MASPRVLVAEGDRLCRELIAASLALRGYDAVLAADGAEAWAALARDDAPRLAVLDQALPETDGLALCRRLRDLEARGRPYTFVLLLVGRRPGEDLAEALAAGADDLLSRPFLPYELEHRLAAARGDAPAPAAPSVAEVATSRRLMDPALSGTVVAGRYRVVRPIAAGGMGVVWEGEHVALGTRVAIKFVRPELVDRAEVLARFEREARTAARLQSRHVVRVYDFGVAEEALPYLVMEYLDGFSLADRIEACGPVPAREVALIVGQAARALARAHAAGVVHRDVKPENIVLVRDGDGAGPYVVKLLDFGLAKVRGAPHDREGGSARPAPLAAGDAASIASEAWGTPHFLSPEQFDGGAPDDPARDLWALAVCAFAAVTGRLPFDGATLDALAAAVRGAPLPVPSRCHPAAPPAFDAWFARACARDRAARFPTADAFAAALDLACAPRPSRPARRPWRSVLRWLVGDARR